MKRRTAILASIVGLATFVSAASAQPYNMGTEFTYQGQLTLLGTPVTGTCEFEFTLWSDPSFVQQLGPMIPATLTLAGGLFSVDLDFGQEYNGQARWLGIDLCCFSPCTPNIRLLPPQELLPTPHALALPGLWSEQNAATEAPNLIGGHADNETRDDPIGATISGGGVSGQVNMVTEDFGTVGGGYSNQAGNDDGNATNAEGSTVGGGGNNTASGEASTVAGGFANDANADYAIVGGGVENESGGYSSFVGGGEYNRALADYVTIGGGGPDPDSVEEALCDAGPSMGAPCGLCNDGVTVCSEDWQCPAFPADQCTPNNGLCLAPGVCVTEGVGNRVYDSYGTVGGGARNQVGGVLDWPAEYGTISGGFRNSVGFNFATIGGGSENTVTSIWATIGGGVHNQAGSDLSGVLGQCATVGGGLNNNATFSCATVSGGAGNTAGAAHSAVGGGVSNETSDLYATIPGGDRNLAAGETSLAAGRRAKANNDGCFVWGDSTDADVACDNDNRWVARASGGVYFYTNSGMTTGSYLAAGSGTWTSLSDREAKENFAPVDGRDVLDKLAAIPLTTWNYKTEDPAIRHMGPMAQDLYAAFGLGDSQKSIGTIDADGVSLAAIRGLHEIVKEKDAEIAELRNRLSALENLAARIEAERNGGAQ
ncbi:MAG: tail fiber domain-containing protein [Phycisphaerales bacterium]|nr:MAG: tail fiber domain-containing protein [Phycisphaerales bacterium]